MGLSLLAEGVVLVACFGQPRARGDAHLHESGIAAEAREDTWMPGAQAVCRAGGRRQEGPLTPELIRCVRERVYTHEGV
jgi:hypothetical protein